MANVSLAGMAMEVFVPSWGEINVSLAATLIFIILVTYLQQRFTVDDKSMECSDGERLQLPEISELESVALSSPTVQAVAKGQSKDWGSSFVYLMRLELLAARNLISANLNGTSDPYAIIECGTQKRFSSVVPNNRNPMWGEEFDFYAEELPVQIKIAIYDWDIVRKSASLGSLIIDINEEGSLDAAWHTLSSDSGQVYLQVVTKCYPVSQSGSLSGYLGVIARRRLSIETSVGTEVRQKPGPLQTIFELPPDEVVEHSYSCALERSFLYHGRLYLSAFHICFHSNVFAKQMKIILPYDDIEEIKKSQHALINPAITVTLRSGSGGQGVPPLVSVDGRARYMFASFWNRNQALRHLQRALNNFSTMQEAAKREQQVSSMRTRSGSSFRMNSQSKEHQASSMRTTYGSSSEVLEEIVDEEAASIFPESPSPFVKDDVLSEVINVELPCTAENYFETCLRDTSKFMQSYCSKRRDSDLQIEEWQDSDEYSGVTRKVTYRSICQSPMCPPDTAVTVWQHAAFSNDKKILVFEAVSQIHDVPFGSYFEVLQPVPICKLYSQICLIYPMIQVHAKWTFVTKSRSLCSLSVRVGAHFKKWCLMQSKIKSGTVLEMKQDAELFIELAKRELEQSIVADVVASHQGHINLSPLKVGTAA